MVLNWADEEVLKSDSFCRLVRPLEIMETSLD
jgi:hypothetical protein